MTTDESNADSLRDLAGFVSLEEYRNLHEGRFDDMSDSEVQRWYDFEMTLAALALKAWLASRRPESNDDTIEEPWPDEPMP
jgi:hypothetical protein